MNIYKMSDYCILITAHRLDNAFAHTLKRLQPDFDIFIHLDKKSNYDIEFFKKEFSIVSNNIHFITRKKVYWGGFSQIDVTIDLLKKAFETSQYKYFLFISGEDYPSKSNEDIRSFLDKSTESYVEFNILPSLNWGFEGGLGRVNKFWLTNFRNRKVTKLVGRLLFYLQKLLCINRSKIEGISNFYGGANWFNLNNSAVTYILDFLEENKKYRNRFLYTRACDEIFFQTILLNNSVGLKLNNRSLRYIDWTSGPTFPKILNIDDIDLLINSDTLFCRKIIDINYMEKIDNLTLKKNV